MNITRSSVLCVDPGISGAVAIFDAAGNYEHLIDLPVIRDMSTAWIDADHLSSLLFSNLNGRPSTAVVERVHAMPKNGSQGAFSQGLTLGSILATLQLVRSSIEFVAPQTWKSSLGLTRTARKLTDKERKDMALSRARLLFPSADLQRQKDHNRAEALLIGHWYFSKSQTRAAA